MNLDRKIQLFSRLGDSLRSLKMDQGTRRGTDADHWNNVIERAFLRNPWFIPVFCRDALVNLGEALTEEKLKTWIDPYAAKIKNHGKIKKIGVINAGNIPAVGFNDFLNVIFSGHSYLGKLSTSDDVLLPALAEKLTEYEPAIKDQFAFTDGKLSDFEAVIATGSNNTSRYFEYYFGKYPHIIRKNRNGVAVLSGKETREDLFQLGKDVFLYFGMGCRSVSKLFVPQDYNFNAFFEAIQPFNSVIENNKYKNNYDYNKAIFLVNREKHFDNNFILLKNDTSYASPPAVLFYEEYTGIESVLHRIEQDADKIQCVVGNKNMGRDFIPFGKSQQPELWDYADDVNTMEFLLSQ